jgi:HSP20 family protein
MAAIGWTPETDILTNLRRMHEELDRMWESAAQGSVELVFPPIIISEAKDSYLVRAELPGLKPADLDISLSGNSLTIRGERKEVQPRAYHRQEREAGNFSRMVGLPGPVDGDRAQAAYANGVLKVVLPKLGAKEPKAISVKPGRK